MTVAFRNICLVAVCGLVISASTAGAQSEPRPAIRVLGGVSAASLASSTAETDALYGLALGAQYVVPVRTQWQVVPEVLLVDKGGRQTSGGASTDADLRSLDVSLLLRWSNGDREARRRVFAFAGPTYGRLLSCEAGSGVGSVLLTGDCLDNINRSDVGLSIGGGLEFPSSSIDWGVSLRYQHGLADVLKSAGELRTRTVVLVLSYRL